MRKFKVDGIDYCEFRDEEAKKLLITKAVYDLFSSQYVGTGFVGVVSVLDGPSGTHWMYEINQNEFIQSVTAITGYNSSPGYIVRARPNVKLAD